MKAAIANEKPFAAYRYPNQKTTTLLVQNTKDLHVFDDFCKQGFVFAPFDASKQAYILPPDVMYQEEVKIDAVADLVNDFEEDAPQKAIHLRRVAKAIDAIKTTNLSKIVISRKETLSSANFEPITAFKKLLALYHNACVYLWFHPKIGIWMGATPETLLTVVNKEFTTMSLAGTLPYLGNLNPVWGQKEVEEQQMVSDFIKQSLNNKVVNLKFSKVETVKAGNLLHLKTKVTGALKKKEDIAKLVDLLHPTPAVCGLPKDESKAFILNNEGYQREFYTGYFGALNLCKETRLFVNLRCFSVRNHKVSLYVGGGITAQSCPENEWKETVEKSKIIKRVLC